MNTTEILLAVLGVFGVAFGVALTFIGSMILHRLNAADKRAAEDRAANKADHDKLFHLVSGLQSEVGDIKAAVSVLKDRSDRAERSDSAG